MRLRDKKYICIRDLQGGDFAVGGAGNIEFWRERAMDWASSDDNMETYYYLKYLAKKEVINFIQEFWQLEIIEVTEELYKVYDMIERISYEICTSYEELFGDEKEKQKQKYFRQGYQAAIRNILYKLDGLICKEEN